MVGKPHKHTSWFISIGLGLAFSSGYVFNLIHKWSSYFIDESPVTILIVPVIFSTTVVALIARYSRRMLAILDDKQRGVALALAATFFITIVARGVLAASGNSLESVAHHLAGTKISLVESRFVRAGVVLGFAIFAYYISNNVFRKGNASKLLRMLCMLGYTLTILAVYKAQQIYSIEDFKALSLSGNSRVVGATISPENEELTVDRRVIWIIFDELDYIQTLGQDATQLKHPLSNFTVLSQIGVNAIYSTSPADGTLVSIPSLLTGLTPIGGRIHGPGKYLIITREGDAVGFSENNTVFGEIKAKGGTYSILGFSHPYCAIFTGASRCDSFMTRFKGFYEALIDWVPLRVRGEIFSSITSWQLELLPEYLGRQSDSLSFIHLNIPHLPAAYASSYFDAEYVADYQSQYSINLKLTDVILGRIIEQISARRSNQKILLVVSGDHGFRLLQNKDAPPRTVPLIFWVVGQSDGKLINTPVSTVHTRTVVSEFLAGRIDSHAVIKETLDATVGSTHWSVPDGYQF